MELRETNYLKVMEHVTEKGVSIDQYIINQLERLLLWRCYSTGNPLRYHSCDSVVVFQYYNKVLTNHYAITAVIA